MTRVTVAIDGPSASGKTTTAREVAARLGYRYLDSGALYRALAFRALADGVDPGDPAAVAALVGAVEGGYDPRGQATLDGRVHGNELRTREVAEAASRISVHPEVRAWVNQRLRQEARGGGVVVEGRDIGTVVLPDAEVKIFLEARLRVRAERRVKDLDRLGKGTPLDQVEDDLQKRDERDSGRSEAPLTPAEGALLLDGSDLDFEAQVAAVIARVAETTS